MSNLIYETQDKVAIDLFRTSEDRVVFRAIDKSDPEEPSWAMELSRLDRAELASLLLESLL